MAHSPPPTPPRSPSPRRALDTDSIFGSSRSASPEPGPHPDLVHQSPATAPAHPAASTAPAASTSASATDPTSSSLPPQPNPPPPTTTTTEPPRPTRRPELSNLPAVRRQHVTTGYRAGLSAGRDDPRTAQAGFDEGYPVGAALGMRAGYLRAMRAAMAQAVLVGRRDGVDGDGDGGVERRGGCEGAEAEDGQGEVGNGQGGVEAGQGGVEVGQGGVEVGQGGVGNRPDDGLGLEALVRDMQARGVLGAEPTVDELDALSPDEEAAREGAGQEWKLERGWMGGIESLRTAGDAVAEWSAQVGIVESRATPA